MKKLIIAALVAVTSVTGAIAVSAECIPCAGADCARREYCMEECINGCARYNDGTYAHRRMGRKGHHSRYYCVNDEYCQYK